MLGSLVALLLAVAGCFNAPLALDAASAGANPGTIKVHDNSTIGEMRNDPHVACPFYFEGFNMVATSGNITVKAWPPTGDKQVVLTSNWSANDLENDTFADHHFLAGPYSLPSGHYKVFISNAPDHVKMKTFWVDCEPTQVAPCPAGNARLMGYSYVIAGQNETDLGDNVASGDHVKLNFAIAAGCNDIQLSLVAYKAPSASFNAATAHLQVLYDSETGFFDAGNHSMEIDVPACFFQVDFVFGAVIVQLGPAGSNNFYTPQGRLIDSDNGGQGSCQDVPAAPPCEGTMELTGYHYFVLDGVNYTQLADIPLNAGDEVTVVFVLEGCGEETLSFVSYNATANHNLPDQTVFESDTGNFTAGTHTLDVTVPPCYYQLDFVFGAPIVHFDGTSAGTYHGQDRFIDGVQGGQACEAPETPPQDLPCPEALSVHTDRNGGWSLVWTPAPGSNGSNVYRAEGSGDFELIATVHPLGFYHDTDVSLNVSHTYMVTALFGGLESTNCGQFVALLPDTTSTTTTTSPPTNTTSLTTPPPSTTSTTNSTTPTAPVPFFPSASATALALAGVVVTGLILMRRRV